MKKPLRVHLVDASPYIFRAYFALPSSIRDRDGRPAGAVRGFADFLLRLIAEEAPQHLGVAFDDSLTSSFRNEFFPAYKAQRTPPPPDLVAQVDGCRRAARALGAATFRSAGYEADDLIGSLCHRLSDARVVIVTSDKDLCQLVGRRVTLLDLARGRRFDPEAVRRRFGVRPRQIVDLLALAGDPVDNIPGVAGIGAKTAASLLAVFADLEAVYDDLGRVERLPIRGARAVRRRLEAGREVAELSKRLATVATDAPVEVDLDRLAYAGADRVAFAQLVAKFGFDSLERRIERWRES